MGSSVWGDQERSLSLSPFPPKTILLHQFIIQLRFSVMK